MKMIIAIVQDSLSNKLSTALIEAEVKATKLSTTGTFLKAGNTTFLIGSSQAKVPAVIEIIKQVCQKHEGYRVSPINLDAPSQIDDKSPLEVQVGGATVFVVPIEEFYHF